MTSSPTDNDFDIPSDDTDGADGLDGASLAGDDGFDIPIRDDGGLVRRRKRRRPKRKKLRAALVVLAVLVLLGGVAIWALASSLQRGESAIRSLFDGAEIDVPTEAVTFDEGKTVSYQGHNYELNEDMVSIVIIGFDRKENTPEDKSLQADAVMVAALDTKTGDLTVIVIPRDSMVDVGAFVGDAFAGIDTLQLCLAYGYGDGGTKSCEYTATAVSRVLYNMPINYYFALDQSGIGPLNDAAGGVALTPLDTIPNTNIVEGQPIVLFGNNAYRYVQYRDTSQLNSSLDRQARQEQYVKAFSEQTFNLSQGNVGVFIDLFNTVGEYSVTNLGTDEFSYLASTVLSNDVNGLQVVTLPGEMVQGDVYAEYYLDKTAVYQTVLDVYYHQID